MLKATPGHETEIKLRLRDAAEGRRRLEQAGFQAAGPRVFEANTIFDTRDRALRAAGSLLRVRRSGAHATVTFKGPATGGKYKSREELEFGTSSAETTGQILERLGFEPVFRYEKYRTEYSIAGEEGSATLDETPIGDFLELEGQPEWIDRSAARLGFTESEYITASYGSLYLDFCRLYGIAPVDMIFGEPGGVS